MIIRHLKICKTLLVSLILAMFLLGTFCISRPVYAINTVFAAPVVIDTGLVSGLTFYINLTIADVEHLWGFQFSIWYDTAVLTATGYESYAPFTLQMPLEINDDIGYIAAASSMLYGEPVGFSTVDPVAVARVDFVVDSAGASTLYFDRHYTQLVNVYANPLTFEIEDGFFSNIELPAHDVAVLRVMASPTTVRAGEYVVIDTLISNQGTENETFNVVARYDDNEIETKTVIDLASGKSQMLTFVWITSDVGPGTYLIEVTASTVEGEVNTANNQLIDGTVMIMSQLLPPIASMTCKPQTPYAGETVTFDASSSYDPDGIIQTYLWYFGDGTPYVEETDPITTHVFQTSGAYTVRLEVVDNDGFHRSTSSTISVLPGVAIKLTSPVDYFWRERVRIRLSALVTDAESMMPVSDATVAVQIYDPDGNLWISDAMIERIAGTGIYEWESSDTIERLQLQKGVYLVHAQASRGGSPIASDILEFHIDPPSDSLGLPASYFVLAAVALAAVAAGAVFLLKRRHSQTKNTRG